MTQTLTSHLSDVGEALFDLYVAHKSDLGLAQVFYGDQAFIPDVPTLCVEPLSVDRAIAGAGLGTNVENQFNCFLMVYHGSLESVQQNRKDADRLAKAIETVAHENLRLGGIIIHGYITKVESGQASRNEIFAVTRLTWEALSKTLLGATA